MNLARAAYHEQSLGHGLDDYYSDDIDFEALTLRVSRSRKLGGAVGGAKSDRARVVHIDPDLAKTLEQQRRSHGRLGRLVFSTSTGSMLNPTNVRNRWRPDAARRRPAAHPPA